MSDVDTDLPVRLPERPFVTVEETLPTDAGFSTPIRRFADQHLQDSVDRALADLPKGKQGAVVAFANLEGAKLAVVARLGERWSVAGVLEQPWHGPLAAEAAAVFSWP